MQEREPKDMSLIGATIIDTRDMSTEELAREGWEGLGRTTSVLVLDDGTVLYPSQDAEGNGPGVLFGVTKYGQTIVVP